MNSEEILFDKYKQFVLSKDKDYANLVDVVFSTKYSQRHYGERLQLYKEFYNKSKPDYMHEFTIWMIADLYDHYKIDAVFYKIFIS